MAKNIVYYFTGTGNSLAVAKSIARELPECLVVSMLCKDALRYINTNTDRIGFVFPIYMNAVPKVVVQFMETLTQMPTTYCFAVATHGGVPGMSGLYLNKVLKKQGIHLAGYFEVKMINNTPKGVAPKFLMSLNWEMDITPDIVEKTLSEAQVMLEDSIEIIIRKETTVLQNIPTGIGRVNYWLMGLVWYISSHTRHKLEFVLDREACTGCETCSHICPTQRIVMEGSKPNWIHEKCYFCYACFNYCHAQAIGVEHYTKSLGRYHHPDCSAEDIARQSM